MIPPRPLRFYPKTADEMTALHRKRLELVKRDALAIGSAALNLATLIRQVLEKDGGTVEAHERVNFLTGAYARLLKDFGIIQALQDLGARQPPPPPPRG